MTHLRGISVSLVALALIAVMAGFSRPDGVSAAELHNDCEPAVVQDQGEATSSSAGGGSQGAVQSCVAVSAVGSIPAIEVASACTISLPYGAEPGTRIVVTQAGPEGCQVDILGSTGGGSAGFGTGSITTCTVTVPGGDLTVLPEGGAQGSAGAEGGTSDSGAANTQGAATVTVEGGVQGSTNEAGAGGESAAGTAGAQGGENSAILVEPAFIEGTAGLTCEGGLADSGTFSVGGAVSPDCEVRAQGQGGTTGSGGQEAGVPAETAENANGTLTVCNTPAEPAAGGQTATCTNPDPNTPDVVICTLQP